MVKEVSIRGLQMSVDYDSTPDEVYNGRGSTTLIGQTVEINRAWLGEVEITEHLDFLEYDGKELIELIREQL